MDASPPAIVATVPSRRRPGILVAGILLVLAPFLYVNPIRLGGFPIAVTGTVAWPWERFATAPVAHAAEVTAQFVLGLLAVLAGFGFGGPRLLLGLLAGGAFYAIRHHGADDAYALVAAESFGLSGFVTTLFVFTGCLLLRSASAEGRSLGRRTVVVGAVLSAVLALACFPTKPPIPDVNLVEEFVRRLPVRIDAILGKGPVAMDPTGGPVSVEVFGKAIPEVLFLVGVACALLGAALARPGEMSRGRRPALFGLVAVLLTWGVPFGYGVGTHVAESVRHGIGSPFGPVVTGTAQMVIEAGLALFLLVGCAFARLAGAEAPAPTAAPALGPQADPTRFRVAASAGALVLGGLTLWVAFQPDIGIFARDRAWTILGTLPGWDRPVAALLAVAVGTLVAAIALVRARERVGVAVLTGALASTFVLDHVLRVVSNDPVVAFFGVTAYVPFALAALLAGLAGRRDRGARAVTLVAAILLLALFAEPGLTFAPKTPMPETNGPYSSLWTIGVMQSRSLADYLFGFVPEHGCPAVVLWLTLLAVASLVGLARRGRATATITRTLFAVAILWPLVQVSAVRPPPGRLEPVGPHAPGSVERAVSLAVFAFVGFALTLASSLSRSRGSRTAVGDGRVGETDRPVTGG